MLIRIQELWLRINDTAKKIIKMVGKRGEHAGEKNDNEAANVG